MTRRIRVTVLYEDRRGPAKGFGLHALVKACVFDAINGNRIQFEGAIDGNPRGPNSQVLRSCREDAKTLCRDGRDLVAVFDNDRVRELLLLPASAGEAEVIAAIQQGTSAPDRLSVVLLDRNLETVVEAAGACDGTLDRDLLTRALGKDLAARDAILNQVSRDAKRHVRPCIQERVPSLGRLVALLCQRLAAHV